MNKFLASLILFLSFLLPFNSYAANETLVKSNNIQEMSYKNEYSVNTNIFFDSQKPYQLVDNLDSSTETVNPNLWITSIFLPGVGQMFMGDVGRGLKFILWTALGLIMIPVGVILGFTYGSFLGSKPKNPTISSLGYTMLISGFIVAGLSHIWNIIDAYNMSKELSEPSRTRLKENNTRPNI